MTLSWHQLIQRDSGLSKNRALPVGESISTRSIVLLGVQGLFSGIHVVSSSVIGQEMSNGCWPFWLRSPMMHRSDYLLEQSHGQSSYGSKPEVYAVLQTERSPKICILLPVFPNQIQLINQDDF